MTRRSPNVEPDGEVASSLDRLREELSVVRQVLDAIYGELQWTNRNREVAEFPLVGSRRITSMPLDPTAPDWAERLNRFTPADLPDDDQSSVSSRQSQLF